MNYSFIFHAQYTSPVQITTVTSFNFPCKTRVIPKVHEVFLITSRGEMSLWYIHRGNYFEKYFIRDSFGVKELFRICVRKATTLIVLDKFNYSHQLQCYFPLLYSHSAAHIIRKWLWKLTLRSSISHRTYHKNLNPKMASFSKLLIPLML